MLDDDDLLGPEELLADDERADRVVGREATRVPDDVGVAGPQAQDVLDRQARIHARQHGKLPPRRERERRTVELSRVALVLGQGACILGARRLDRHEETPPSNEVVTVDGGGAGPDRALALYAVSAPRR